MKTVILKSMIAVLLPASVWAQTSVKSNTANYFGDNAECLYDKDTRTLTIRPNSGEGSTQQSWDMFSGIKVLASDQSVNNLGTGDNWTYTKGVYKSFEIRSGVYTSAGQDGKDELSQNYRFVDFVPTSGNITVGFNIPNTFADTYDIYLVTCPIWMKDDYNNIPQEEWDARPYRFTAKIIEREDDGENVNFPYEGVSLENPNPIDETLPNIFLSQGIAYDKDGYIIVNDTTYLGQYQFKNSYYGDADYGVIIQIGSSILSSQRRDFSNEMLISSIILKPHRTDASFDVQEDVEHIVVENGITEINYAFDMHGFSNIKTVEISNSVKSIGMSAFRNCNGLTSLTIPNSVNSIGMSAFRDCSGLTSLMIPNSVTSIGDDAFDGCSGLTSVIIGEGITEFGAWFAGNTSIQEVKMGDKVTSIGEGAFKDCTHITFMVVPNSVNSIGDGAFSGCSGLTSLPISENVTSIGANSYQNCIGLTSIGIPNSVKSIGESAFSGCSGLTAIKVEWNRPLAIYSNVFNNVDHTNCKLYVPKGTATMFMSAPEWSKFVNILEYEDGEDAHYITIRMGDGGVLKQSVEVGQTYTYAVSADEGWEVNTLTFDGKDMTSLLMDGQFSTPVITSSAELNVVFKQIDTNVKEMPSMSDVKVYASNKSITVAGAEEKEQVVVYGINGVPVTSAVGNTTFSLESGVYIVKVGEETFKVRL